MSKQPTNKALQVQTTQAIIQSAFSSKAMTKSQMNILRTQIAPDITDNDLMYCLEIADNTKLNPILQEIYFVPRMSQVNGRWITKHQPMVGRRGARTIARRKGMKVPPNTGHTLKKYPKFVNGQWVEEKDLIGWAELVVDGQVVRKEAAFSVYKQTKKDGTITKFWQTMPTVMVEKVAEFQLLDAVYGLDGVISIDAGVLQEEDEPIVTEVNNVNKEDIIQALESLGLSYEINDNLLVVKGNTFQHSKMLKSMGFGFFNNQWQIGVTNGSEKVEVVENPVNDLMNYLKQNDLTKQEIGQFVKEVLKLTSADVEGIKAVLTNKDDLDVKIQEFLAGGVR